MEKVNIFFSPSPYLSLRKRKCIKEGVKMANFYLII